MKDVLRSNKCFRRYSKHKKVSSLLGLPLLRKFKYWVLVKNQFPYDLIAKKHVLLVPKRKFVHDSEMKSYERKELWEIKNKIDFDAIIENTMKNRSVPGHYHLHCVKYKYIYKFEDKK